MDYFKIKNGDKYDFFIMQNYLIELVANKIINKNSFLLYAFYRSLSGFTTLQCSYEYIKKNTGLSKGAISGSNKQLEDKGLIKIINKGYNKPNEIILRDGNELPRRTLRKVNGHIDDQEYEEVKFNPIEEISYSEESSVDEHYNKESSADELGVQYTNSGVRQDEPINIEYIQNKIDNTTTGVDKERLKFIKEFKNYWCKINKTDRYRINDEQIVKKIDNITLARKLIPILWSLDEKDKWVRNSNHSLTVFVKEFLNGNLQDYYPKTGQYYKDKNRKIE